MKLLLFLLMEVLLIYGII